MTKTTKKTTTRKAAPAAKKQPATKQPSVNQAIPTLQDLRHQQTKPLKADQVADLEARLKKAGAVCERNAKTFYGIALTVNSHKIGTLWAKQVAYRFTTSPRILKTFSAELQKFLAAHTVFKLTEKGTEYEAEVECPTEFVLYEPDILAMIAAFKKAK